MSPRSRNALIIVLCVVAAVIVTAWAASGALSRYARDRAISTLKDQYASELEIKSLNISLFPSVAITGEGLVLRYHGRTDLPPLITISKFSGNGSLIELLRKHVGSVTLEGLRIEVPPPEDRCR